MKKIILASVLAATTCFTMTTQANATPSNTHHAAEQHNKPLELNKKQAQHKAAATKKHISQRKDVKKAPQHHVTSKKVAPKSELHKKQAAPKHNNQPHKKMDDSR